MAEKNKRRCLQLGSVGCSSVSFVISKANFCSYVITFPLFLFVYYFLRDCRHRRRWTWTGDFKCREVKTGFCRKRWTQTGSSGTLIGWKSGQTTFIPLWDRMEGALLWTRSTTCNDDISFLSKIYYVRRLYFEYPANARRLSFYCVDLVGPHRGFRIRGRRPTFRWRHLHLDMRRTERGKHHVPSLIIYLFILVVCAGLINILSCRRFMSTIFFYLKLEFFVPRKWPFQFNSTRLNSTRLDSTQFNSIQFNPIQLISIQLSWSLT